MQSNVSDGWMDVGIDMQVEGYRQQEGQQRNEKGELMQSTCEVEHPNMSENETVLSSGVVTQTIME